MKTKPVMQLYVWTDVFRDWTGGLAFAVAESADKAREQIAQKMGYARDSRAMLDLAVEPQIFNCKSPVAFGVVGGQ